MDQGEGITGKFRFAAKQLKDRKQLHMPGVSGEVWELLTTLHHGQALVNQNDEFP